MKRSESGILLFHGKYYLILNLMGAAHLRKSGKHDRTMTAYLSLLSKVCKCVGTEETNY